MGQNESPRVAAPISGYHSSALPSQPTGAEMNRLAALFNAGRHAELESRARLFQYFNTGHTFASDLEDMAHCYKEYHRLMAHWRVALPSEVFMDVSYEALVEDQEGWSHKIIEFIWLDWDERCLNFHETERTVGTASNWQVRQKIYKSSKERWRNYEKHVGPLLELLELYPSAIAQ